MSTSVEALGTVTGVQKESLVALNEAELITQTLDLKGSNDERVRRGLMRLIFLRRSL